MEIRSRLNDLSRDVASASLTWGGDEEMVVAQAPTTIHKLGKLIEDTLNCYQVLEKSLAGRIETTRTLSHSLNLLIKKIHSSKSLIFRFTDAFGLFPTDQEKVLWPLAKKVNQSISRWSAEEKNLQFGTTPLLKIFSALQMTPEWMISKGFDEVREDVKTKVKECAFRTVKDLGFFEKIALDSKIEGSDPTIVVRGILEDLNAFFDAHQDLMSAKQKTEFQTLLSSIKNSSSISEENSRIVFLDRAESQGLFSSDPYIPSTESKIREKRIADLAYKIEKSIEKLEVGQAMIIPGGYTTASGSGHAVIYEVKRVKGEEFHFSVFNTGQGATFGAGLLGSLRSYWTNQTGIRSFVGLSRETVSDQPFLMNLLRFNIERSSQYDMDTVIQTLKMHLSDPNENNFVIQENVHLQTWGTCTFDCIMSYLECRMQPSLFYSFQLYTMKKALEKLNRLLPVVQREELFNEATIRLLAKKPRETVDGAKKKYYEQHKSDCDRELAQKIFKKDGISNEAQLRDFLERKMARINEIHHLLRQAGWMASYYGQGSVLAFEKHLLQEELSQLEKLLQKSDNQATIQKLSNSQLLFTLLHEKNCEAALFRNICGGSAAGGLI